jgi:phage shock protein A
MEEQTNPQENKLLSYISLGISSLVIAHILYMVQTINATSQSVIRLEENSKIIVKQVESTESKLERLDSRIDQIEATKPNNARQ